VLSDPAKLLDLPVQIEIRRGGQSVFQGETRTSRMKRTPEELAGYLTMELAFPRGVLLFTGTGIVPPGEFTMQRGDVVAIRLAELLLENAVADS
jgi:2-dehydro-3-deoxy-D-arabinonate dehydratase